MCARPRRFLGGLIDNIGMRAIFCLLAAVFISGLHAVLSFTTLYPVAPLVALGLCYSIYAAALWPSIALVIPPENQATACESCDGRRRAPGATARRILA